MSGVNINEFMHRFHAIELDLNLFESTAGGELWWDSVRFDICYFLYGRLANITYIPVVSPASKGRALGRLRRWGYRQLLFARAAVDPKEFLIIRAARNIVQGQRQDVALDPVAGLFRENSRTIDTLPRRYHLPSFDSARWTASVPQSLPAIIDRFLAAYGIDKGAAAQLEGIIRRVRADYASQLHGYRHMFDRMRPKAILMVQNGIEKPLFHVANERGVPIAEVQHGLIGYGHPAYSYPRGVDYTLQPGFPGLFLIFSDFWRNNGYYPARRQAVIGTDHFATGFAQLRNALGTVMLISANVYHPELFELTRQIASRLPGRKFLYKLHPNQEPDEAGIRRGFSDLANVEVGAPLTPASRLMEDVSHVVAVQSTVVYEAMQHGRRICILPRHDYHIHSDIFELPSVAVPLTIEDLVAALEVPAQATAGPVFFEKFDPERARAVLAPFLSGQA